MIKTEIVFNKEKEKYFLKGCVTERNPSYCQTFGCKYWQGYVFENAFTRLGKYGTIMLDYESSQWRKLLDGKVTVANYVKCSIPEGG